MSRLWRYGSVYSRTRDFLVGKMNPWEARPIWFDVWTRHPPRRDPVLLERVPINALGYRDRRHPDFNFQQPPNLVYKTDYVRFVSTYIFRFLERILMECIARTLGYKFTPYVQSKFNLEVDISLNKS